MSILIPKTPNEYWLYSTIRLSSMHQNTQRIGHGTGFILTFHRFADGSTLEGLVTNKHVIEEAEDLNIVLHEGIKESDGTIPSGKTFELKLKIDRSCWIDHPDKDVDLCCFPFGSIFQLAMSLSHIPYFTTLGMDSIMKDDELLESFSAVLNVLMYGYPIGLFDEKNNFPLIRQGITASHPGIDFNGKPVGALDIASFPGSSGSPIFFPRDNFWYSKKDNTLYGGGKRPVFLGVLYGGGVMKPGGMIDIQSIPMQNQLLDRGEMLAMHAGFYVKAKELFKLKEAFLKQYPLDQQH